MCVYLIDICRIGIASRSNIRSIIYYSVASGDAGCNHDYYHSMEVCIDTCV